MDKIENVYLTREINFFGYVKKFLGQIVSSAQENWNEFSFGKASKCHVFGFFESWHTQNGFHNSFDITYQIRDYCN